MYREYLILFDILEYCFNNNSNDLDLPPFLGEISPYLWDGGMPIDCSVYDDWLEISRHINNHHELIDAIIELLELYEKSFSFDFCETKKVLRHIPSELLEELSTKYTDV